MLLKKSPCLFPGSFADLPVLRNLVDMDLRQVQYLPVKGNLSRGQQLLISGDKLIFLLAKRDNFRRKGFNRQFHILKEERARRPFKLLAEF